MTTPPPPPVIDYDALTAAPDAGGHFGAFGGVFIPEMLHAACAQLAEAYDQARADPAFKQELDGILRHYVGRATPLQFAERLTERIRQTAGGQDPSDRSRKTTPPGGKLPGELPGELPGAGSQPTPVARGGLPGGGQLWLKREDLAHTGAHKINNSLGQALLAMRMGKKRIIAETGAGQHGVATATAAAKFGLECVVYMGSEDIRRQRPNVLRMKMMGATVEPVESGSKTLKDATNAAMRDWMATSEDTHYIIGSVVGPHPFPKLVRDFQSVIGTECRAQCLDQMGRLPDHLVACVGGGSNAAGLFFPFIGDRSVKMTGVEAGGRSTEPGDHAAPLCYGSPGVLHGSLSYVLQNPDGQTADVHSISAGLDYPGVGPEHSHWRDTGRVAYTAVTDAQALTAFTAITENEGILPALESSHALACGMELAAGLDRDQIVVVNLSGRGDKDLDEAIRLLGMDVQ